MKQAKTKTEKPLRSMTTNTKKGKPFRSMTNMQKRAWWGRLFILPWVIGLIWFFILPMIQTFYYSFSKITITAGGLHFSNVGFTNYLYYFTQDPNFIQSFAGSLGSLLISIPLIVCFSLFVAIVLSEKFHGRTFFRAVFFFPVIIASGVVINILTTNLLMNTASVSSNQPAYMFQAPDLNEIFTVIGLPSQLLAFISKLISEVFNLTWKSGVQILLLLAAINGIPSSFYEVADMEGATGWEKFWKITLPTALPTLLVAIIYTIIDSFTDVGNSVMKMITDNFKQGSYENAATIGIVYFFAIMIIVGIVQIFLSKHINYAAD